MSYNSNASSNGLNNNMEIINQNQQTEMNTNNNNDSSNTSSVTSQTPKLSPNNSSKSNSPTSSSSSEESGKITSIESDQATTKTNMHHLNSYDYDDEEEDDDNNNNNNNNEDEEENEEDNDENNTQYNSSTDSNRTNINNNSDSNNNNNNSNNNNNNVNNTNVDLSPRPVSAYERLTKSVRSFLNATRILRNPLTNGSPESSAAEENSSSNNQGSSPFSASTASTSSASPQSSSSSFQSGLSPPSMSSSNQSNSLSSSSSSSKNRHHYHHHHHSSHHHASSSSSSSLNKNVMNMTKKSNLFDDILKQFSENTATNRENNNVLISKAKPSHKINKKNLKNLLNIYKNNENYYTTMFFPITDNYKLESAKTRRTFRASSSNMSHHHRSLRQNSASKKEIQLIKSNGEDSNDANEIETAYNKQKDETEAAAAAAAATASSSLSESPSSESSASSNNNNKSTDQKATNSNNNASNTSNGNQQQQNTKTNKKSTEFFTCPLCTHCLYEPITLVCGCTFCKNCLNEFNLTLIKLTLIKLAKRNAADSLNELDLFSTGKNKMDTSKAYSQEENQSKKCGGECQSDDEQNSISPSSSTASSSSSSPSDDNSNSTIKKLKNLNLSLFKCFNCSKVHELNTAEYLKMNTNISTITEKLFDSKVEIRKLRNDIRRYIVLHLENDSNSNNVTRHFDLDRYETMLNHAYNLDKTNHLLLADLFMLNYFSGRLDKALDYANKTTELRPKWAFSYFMKSIYYQKISDLNNLRSNLIQTFQLDSSIEQIRYKIFQINYILLKPNHTQITDGKQALAYLKKKDLQDLTSIKRSASSFNFNQDSIQMSESSSSSKFPKISPHIQFQSKKRYHSSDTDGKHFSKNYDFKIRDSCESISTDQSEIPSEQSNNLVINDSLLNTSDLECSLCYRLFYNPVTTPCGHSYCCSCLERSLDYQDKCPLCKNSLAEYLAERRQNLTVFLDSLIKNYFPKDYEVRKRQHLDELKELTNNDNEIPVFVCTTALPFASCPLHIYEPHYRLMLRRAIESGSKQFGMCMYSDMTPYLYTEYGCMLEIRNYQFTKDGRAVVATTGGRRFKVVHAYMKDGYNVAQIQWVTDIREETVEGIQELQNLHDKTYQLALKWYSQLPEIQKQKILEIYGELPQPEENIQANDNGPVWHWFLLNILPLENDFQYMFLTKTSLKERLKQIKKLLIFMLLIDRSRQVTPSTSSQNLYIQDNGEADN
jgi:hypothetical protein